MENLDASRPLIIDVGCGGNRRKEATYGVDLRPSRYVDVLCDAERGLPFKTGSIDGIYTSHFLEHIENLEGVIREFVRVLKPGGKMFITVPHFSNTLAYSDYTHRRFFGFFTFDYFSRETKYKGALCYTPDIDLKIVNKRLVFKQLSFLGPMFERLVNCSARMSYLYESHLAWIVPCFEIRLELQTGTRG